MKGDMKLKAAMKKLQKTTNAWCDYVDGYGCQCAYTDRMFEDVVEITKEIQTLAAIRDKEFKRIRGDK
jgi:hypothetical protein